MISVENLTKVYRSKKGVDVEALKGISLNLPSRGMVFVLGKSGCGKSTLLNVLGGLDGFDGGAIRVGGKNLKDFTTAELNNYRNTFTGFVFQDYNLVDGYTVAENVALALNLQGNREADRVDEILKKVELEELKDRKPPNISGGQRQRVVIARALVKDAKLILCDEPTGALDSETGESVFKLLKEVSKDRLVVVVSHDRDFAEKFGDRIIEMKDGRIERDSAAETEEEQVEIAAVKGSRLSAKNSFKMGLGYLAHRKTRLVFAMIIAVLTLSMFGFANVMAAFSPKTVLANAYKDGVLSHVTYAKQYNANDPTRDTSHMTYLSNEDLQRISKELNCEVTPVYRFFQNDYGDFAKALNNSVDLERNLGYAEINQKFLDNFKFKLDGRLPVNKDEIVITEYVYSLYNRFGYEWEGREYEIKEHSDLIGKRLTLRDGQLGEITPEIVGILDTELYSRTAEKLFAKNDKGEEYEKDVDGLSFSLHNVFYTCEGFYDSSVTDYISANYYAKADFKLKSPLAEDYSMNGVYSQSYFTKHGSPEIYFKEGASLSNLSGNQIIVHKSCLKDLPTSSQINDDANDAIDAFAAEHFPLIEDKVQIGEYAYHFKPVSVEGYAKYIKEWDLNLLEPEYNHDYFLHAAEQKFASQYFEEHAEDLSSAKLSYRLSILEQAENNYMSFSAFTWGNGDIKVEVVGYYDGSANYTIVSDEVFGELRKASGYYDCAFAAVPVPSSLNSIKNLIDFTDVKFEGESVLVNTHSTESYVISNHVTNSLESVSGLFDLLATIFLWVSLAMCAVIIIFMAYYFSGIIMDKKQEIGILRALGASKRDIANIFFAENGIIGAIIAALSVIISAVLSSVTNGILVKELALSFSIVVYPVWNVFVLIAATAFALSLGLLLPLLKTLKKKPVEILREKD